MKKLLIVTLVLVSTSLWAQEAKKAAEKTGPTITFSEEKFEFGEIAQGDKVSHTFNFENTGTEALIISNVRTTCGCTVPSWPKEPIAAGAKGKIDVVFNSRGKMGAQNKVITVQSNATNAQARVALVGNVLPPKPKTDGSGN